MIKPVWEVLNLLKALAKLPLILRPFEPWNVAVSLFAVKLRDRLGEKLRYVIASPSEDLLVYDSNVLVVVDAEDFEVRKDVIEIEGEVEKEFSWKIGISPLITKENNEAKLFIEVFGWKNIKY